MIEVKVGVPPAVSEEVLYELLQIGAWHVGPVSAESKDCFNPITKFANGDIADNKLYADLPLEPYERYTRIVPEKYQVSRSRLASARKLVLGTYDDLLDPYQELPDAVWGTPAGGQLYAEIRAMLRGMQFVRLEKVECKTEGQKLFRPATKNDARKLAKAQRMIGSEDAGSEAASVEGAMVGSNELGLTDLGLKTIALHYVFVRGLLSRLPDGTKVSTLVDEKIPVRIKRSDDFYQRFGRLAVQL